MPGNKPNPNAFIKSNIKKYVTEKYVYPTLTKYFKNEEHVALPEKILQISNEDAERKRMIMIFKFNSKR